MELGFRPNQFLMCPAGWNDEQAHQIAPVFAVPLSVLRDGWERVLEKQPRLEIRNVLQDQTYYEFVQRSALLRFPDRISALLVSLGRGRSTLAIYSRSTYGYSDLGVNKARIEAWIDTLEKELR